MGVCGAKRLPDSRPTSEGASADCRTLQHDVVQPGDMSGRLGINNDRRRPSTSSTTASTAWPVSMAASASPNSVCSREAVDSDSGEWIGVGNGKLAKTISGWNNQLTCKVVTRSRSVAKRDTLKLNKSSVDCDKPASRRFGIIRSEASAFSIPAVGPFPSSLGSSLGTNCAATGPWCRWDLADKPIANDGRPSNCVSLNILPGQDPKAPVNAFDDILAGDQDSVLATSSKSPCPEIPTHGSITGDAPDSDWNSEVEVSETEFVELDPDNTSSEEDDRVLCRHHDSAVREVSVHKRRTPIVRKRRERKVRIQESTRQEQERQIARLIREEDAVHGFQRFHGRFETVDFISKTSCGIGGWARYERGHVARADVMKRSREIASSVDVSSSIRAPLGDVSLNRVEGGRVEPEVQTSQHLSCGGSQGENYGCCNFSCSQPLDLHLDELSYCRKRGDNQISSAAESDRGWVKIRVTVDSGACDRDVHL